MTRLRQYQADCLEAICQAEREGCIDQLVALPCGTGKTVIAAGLPDAIGLLPWEVQIFLVDSEELSYQAVDELQEANPGRRVTLEKAEHHGEQDADIVVASISTLATSDERLTRLAKRPIRVVFLDECHSAVSPKYRYVLHTLRCLKGEACRNPRILHVGLTATPRRHDGLALERVYSRIVYRRAALDMVREGWVAEPIAYRVETAVDLEDVHMRDGDFQTGELSRRVNTPATNALVVRKYMELGEGLPAIAFTVDIQHSEDLAATFRQHGLAFEAISSHTSRAQRKKLVQAHRNMELRGLVSCQALMIGFNSPPATVCLWARPTKSGLLYTQGTARTGRPYPAPEAAAGHTGYRKRHNIIIDFTSTSARHRLYTAAVLYGLNPKFDFNGKPIESTLRSLEKLQQKNPSLDITAVTGLEDAQARATKVDLWSVPPLPQLARSCSQFAWMQIGDTAYRLHVPGVEITLEQNLLGSYDVSCLADDDEPEPPLQFGQPEDAFAYADSLVPEEAVKLVRAKAHWRRQPPTEAQCVRLWQHDSGLRRRFTTPEAFHRYADYHFGAGNLAFSRGGLSFRIELANHARQKSFQHT